jgi:hypothetical protein
MSSAAESELQNLHHEAAALGRYLLGRPAPKEALRRYVEGSLRLFDGTASREDLAIVAFVRRHSWSLPPLDAACGLLRPRSLLRQKLILMLAILETVPEIASDFLPVARPRALVVVRLLAAGLVAGLKTAAGLLILPAARRSG